MSSVFSVASLRSSMAFSDRELKSTMERSWRSARSRDWEIEEVEE